MKYSEEILKRLGINPMDNVAVWLEGNTVKFAKQERNIVSFWETTSKDREVALVQLQLKVASGKPDFKMNVGHGGFMGYLSGIKTEGAMEFYQAKMRHMDEEHDNQSPANRP